MRTLAIPELSLVVLIGVSGSGKSTFAARHFKPTEVLSSDECRALISDDPNDQTVTEQAFQVLHTIAGARLALGRLTVVDATSVQPEARRPLVALAREHHVVPVAIVLDVREEIAHGRNADRPDRDFGPHVVRRQANLLRRSMRGLQREGFRQVYVLRGQEQIDAVEVVRERTWTNRSDLHGPFDIVGDVHGCAEELSELLDRLGYVADDDGARRHPDDRVVVFLGDLVDRGPDTPGVLRTAMSMVAVGSALCVPGNHENKLLRALRGRNVQITHGLGESLAQLGEETEEFRASVETFIDGLISHAVLDDGKLVVAHAGLPEQMHGRASAAVRSFALYGETSGEIDEFGLPVRYPWAVNYRGDAIVVYGHTPIPEAEWINNTICVDTGCVFGGSLTALRYPERELVSVRSKATYYEPAKPFLDDAAAPAGVDARPDEQLDIEDVLGKRGIQTRLMGRLTIPEGNGAAALEVMSRFAVDPRWLVYLPPTMAPSATSSRDGLLEHPDEAFDEYRREGVPHVICEEKHMGSRAVVSICRTADVAARRFRIDGDGHVVTRTGRSFFTDAAMENAFLEALRLAIDGVGLWEELEADWLLLDAEILPWSLKAEQLLRTQYASVGAAATAAQRAAVTVARQALDRGVDVAAIVARGEGRTADIAGFVDAYRRYCWTVNDLRDVRVAPFQVLAAGSRTCLDREHEWHMAIADRLAAVAPDLVRPTRNLTVDVTDPASQAAAVSWWEALTAEGGEGMVVKPSEPVVRGSRGPVQPGIKVRGREYLRIIYGPDYTAPRNLERLRTRGLGRKRSLAAREFALGVEALERVARGEPLHRVHECVFGVLALESEPVDPRL
jgi:protein phosphatase